MIALAGPPKTITNVSTEVLVVSLRWTSWDRHPSVLLVCYQNHGILYAISTFLRLSLTLKEVCMNLQDGHWYTQYVSATRCECLIPRDILCSHSGRARTDLSPDGQYIALYNLAKGIEVRKLSNGALRCAFPLVSREKRLLPVVFVHGGEVLIAGTTDGDVGVWHLETSQKIQNLHHSSACVLICLQSCPII